MITCYIKYRECLRDVQTLLEQYEQFSPVFAGEDIGLEISDVDCTYIHDDEQRIECCNMLAGINDIESDFERSEK